MTDTPSSILLLRLQSTGSNTNLWGGYLNAAMQTIERAAKGYQSYAVTTDATINWTNYSATNDGAVAAIKFTGSPSGAVSLTFPSYQNFLFAWNATSVSLTIKCSGGTGVTLASGQRALLYCDAVDYVNAAPTKFPTANITFGGQLKNVTAGTDGTDGVNKTQMDNAIALATFSSTPGTVRITAGDTTAKFFFQAQTFNVGDLMSLQASVLNPAADEQVSVTASPTTLWLNFLQMNFTEVTTTTTAVAYTPYVSTVASQTINLGGLTSNQAVMIARDLAAGHVPVTGGTFDGQAGNFLIDEERPIILFGCESSGVYYTRLIGQYPTT